MIYLFIIFMFYLVLLLVCVAYLTLAERKILGAMQMRLGPNYIGFFGLLQPFADGVKLLLKETVLPRGSNRALFVLAPLVTFILSLVNWVVIPFSDYCVLANIDLGSLFILTLSSLNVYGIVVAGWSSNSKYAFLGSIRSAAQMISYEISIGFILIIIMLCVGSLNLSSIVLAQINTYFIVPFFPLFVVFFVAVLAETSRTPFDLPEAEAELVAGYNVEYSSMIFALFFLAEYSNMILMSAFMVILFFGGWLPIFQVLDFLPGFFWFIFKIVFLLFIFIWVRASFPRYRYDQLMALGWKIFLPFTFSYLFFFIIVCRQFLML